MSKTSQTFPILNLKKCNFVNNMSAVKLLQYKYLALKIVIKQLHLDNEFMSLTFKITHTYRK